MAGLNNVNVSFGLPDVGGWFNVLNEYAVTAMNSAYSAANTLNSFTAPNLLPSVQYLPTETSVSLGTFTKPTVPSISTSTHVLPSSPLITTPTIGLVTTPTFTDSSPDINLPSLPDPLSITFPTLDFTINTNFTYPTEPITILPTVPTLLSLNIPTALSINLPTFDLAFPTSNLAVPDITFNFSEVNYSDTLLTNVKNTLIARLQGGTGLNPVVEQAIWDRGRDRENRQSLMAERTLLIERGQTGLSRPSGATSSALAAIVQETQGKLIELSREIMIKQAELEQENLKQTIQQTISLEDILIRQYNNVIQRSFEVAKYTQDVLIEIFKAKVGLYNTQVEAFKSYTVAYTSKVQSELAKVEIFKAQIDAEKLKGDINEQSIRTYVAQIDAVKTNVELYKALVETVSVKLQAEAIKVGIYKTEVEAYGEGVRAKASEYSMYSEQLKGEMAKVEIYNSKVNAFATRIQAYSTQSEVNNKIAETSVDIQELNIKKYQADVDAFSKQVQSEQLMYQSAVDLYKGQSALYLADIGLSEANANMAIKNSENIIQQNKYASDVSIANANMTLQSLIASYGATLEGKKAAGSIYSQLSASALSAINVSTSLSGQSQLSASENHNYTGA